MLDKPSRGDITTSSRLQQRKVVRAQGFFTSALEGLSAIYAFSAKFTLEGVEGLADRRAEKRAVRLARAPTLGAASGKESSRPLTTQWVSPPRSAPKRAPKSR
jgi:hypothetical protein